LLDCVEAAVQRDVAKSHSPDRRPVFVARDRERPASAVERGQVGVE
jgi:hypothetical protein